MTSYKRVLATSMVNGAMINGSGNIHTVPATSSFAYQDAVKLTSINSSSSAAYCQVFIDYIPFSPNVTGFVGSFAEQPDGRIVLGGSFTAVNGVARTGGIARILANGTLDTSFNPSTGGITNTVTSIAIQTDGKIIIGGWFDSVNGVARTKIARLEADGSLDATFNPNLGNALVHAVAIQSSGNILIGGQFNTSGGTPLNGIVRYSPNGTLDSTFNPNATAIYSITLRSDDSMAIGGMFSTVGAVAQSGVAILFANGARDSSFANPNVGNGLFPIRSIEFTPNGSLLVAGEFMSVGGVGQRGVCRLFPNGVRDSSFVANVVTLPPLGPARMYGILRQHDGKILFGGSVLQQVNNTFWSSGIVRVFDNGVLDTSFQPRSFALARLQRLRDGRIIAGAGSDLLDSSNIVWARRIAKFGTSTADDVGLSVNQGANYTATIFESIPARSVGTINDIAIVSNSNAQSLYVYAPAGVYTTAHVDRVEG